MSCYKILTESERLDKLSSLAHGKKVTAILGSGISFWAPTSLPMGSTFTSALYDLLFPLASYQSNANDKDSIRKQYDKIPFEVILEKSPDEKKLRPFLRKLYACDRANDVHNLIADACASGIIHDVITTNYDCAFDTALSMHGGRQGDRFGPLKRVIGEPKTRIKPDRYYFKIHGSTDDNEGETLIFSLNHESRLAGKKASLFRDLVSNRFIIVIGYSGRDFEICPELVALPLYQILWICLNENDLGIGGMRVLKSKGGTMLEGDLSHWLYFLLGKQLDLKKFDVDFPSCDLVALFSAEELALWRVAILNHLSHAKKAIIEVNNIALNKLAKPCMVAHAHALRGDALFHNGKYGQALEAYQTAFYLANDDASIATRVEYLISISNNALLYGRPIKAKIAALRARLIALKSPGLSAVVRQTRLVTIGFIYRMISNRKPFVWIKNILRLFAARTLKSMTHDLLDIGAYINYHHLVLWIDRFDASHLVDIPRRRYLDASAIEGFEEVGYLLAVMFAFRLEKISIDDSEWDDKATILSEKAENLGLHAEAYKIFRLRSRKHPNDHTLKEAEKRNFMQCEYLPWMRTIRKKWT